MGHTLLIEEILHQKDAWKPINNGINHLSTGWNPINNIKSWISWDFHGMFTTTWWISQPLPLGVPRYRPRHRRQIRTAATRRRTARRRWRRCWAKARKDRGCSCCEGWWRPWPTHTRRDVVFGATGRGGWRRETQELLARILISYTYNIYIYIYILIYK